MGIDRLAHVGAILFAGKRLAKDRFLLVREGTVAHTAIGVGVDVDVRSLDHSHGEFVELLLLVLLLKAGLVVAIVASSVREAELLLLLLLEMLLLLLEAVGPGLETIALAIVIGIARATAHAAHAVHSHAHTAVVETTVGVATIRLLSMVGVLLLEGVGIVHVLAGRGSVGGLDLELLLMMLLLHRLLVPHSSRATGDLGPEVVFGGTLLYRRCCRRDRGGACRGFGDRR